MDDRHFNINDRFGALPTSAPHAGGGEMTNAYSDAEQQEKRKQAARIAALESVATAARAFINAGTLDMDRFQYNRLRELRAALAALAPAPAPEAGR